MSSDCGLQHIVEVSIRTYCSNSSSGCTTLTYKPQPRCVSRQQPSHGELVNKTVQDALFKAVTSISLGDMCHDACPVTHVCSLACCLLVLQGSSSSSKRMGMFTSMLFACGAGFKFHFKAYGPLCHPCAPSALPAAVSCWAGLKPTSCTDFVPGHSKDMRHCTTLCLCMSSIAFQP